MFPVIHWNFIGPECVVVATLVVLMIVDMFLPKNSKKDWVGGLSFVGLAVTALVWSTQSQLRGETFGGMISVDALTWFFKGFFLLTMLFVFTIAQQFFKDLPARRNIFYLLLWLALLGMCFVASAADFLILFIAIEILTIALYVMTAYLKSDKHSLEAGMKYLILGALASGFFLYGISFLYGVAHSTRFGVVQAWAMAHPTDLTLLLGLVFVFAAVGFKIASVPFHMWVPDVYQGAPTPVTALLSVGSKAAGFVVLLRLFFGVFASCHAQWSGVLAVLAAVTMCYGNVVAMFQTNIKRLLAYSSIGHAGYLLMGVAAGSVLGASAINFYLAGYLFASLSAFLVITVLSTGSAGDVVDDYSGLAQRSPFLAAVLVLSLVSLAGIPPLVGFFGKFALLVAVVQSGIFWLAGVAAVNIVIAMYYYMVVAKKIYADAPCSTQPIVVSWPVRLLLGAAMLAMVATGLCQGPLLNVSRTAVNSVPAGL